MTCRRSRFLKYIPPRDTSCDQCLNRLSRQPELCQNGIRFRAESRRGRRGRKALAIERDRRGYDTHGPGCGVRHIVQHAVGMRLRIIKHLDGELDGGHRNPSVVEQRGPLGGGLLREMAGLLAR